MPSFESLRKWARVVFGMEIVDVVFLFVILVNLDVWPSLDCVTVNDAKL